MARDKALVYGLENYSDREVAILADALLEIGLLHSIIATFEPITLKQAQELRDANGPLSTVSSQIKIANALGLLSDAMLFDAARVHKVRNRAAHDLLPAPMNAPPNSDICASLQLPHCFEEELKAVLEKMEIREVTDPFVKDEEGGVHEDCMIALTAGGEFIAQIPTPRDPATLGPKALFAETTRLLWFLLSCRMRRMRKGFLNRVRPDLAHELVYLRKNHAPQ